jgi:hypothetical protein
VNDVVRAHRLGRADADQVLRALAQWAPVGAPIDPLHLGDIGWQLRFEPELVDGRLVIWSGVDGPVAAGLLLGDSLGCAFAPGARGDRGGPGGRAGELVPAVDVHRAAVAGDDGSAGWCALGGPWGERSRRQHS